MDPYKHLKVARRFAVFFLVIAGISVLGLIGTLVSGDGSPASQERALGFGVAAFMLFLASLAAYNGARTGGVVLLVFFLLTLISDALLGALGVGGFVRGVFYISAAGYMTWKLIMYHRAIRDTGSTKRGNKVFAIGSVVVALPTIAFLLFGASVLHSGVSTRVLAGTEIPPDQIQWMRDNGFLVAGEEPIFFYSEGLYSIAEGGNLLTTQYVGSWTQVDGEASDFWMKLGEVCRVEQIAEGSLIAEAKYRLHSAEDNDWLELWLSIENDGHQRFVERLKTLNKRRMHPSYAAYCDSGETVDWAALAKSNGISQQIETGEEIDGSHLTWLRENKFLLEREAPLFFRSSGRYHIEEGGVLLTDAYFGGWFQEEYKLSGWWAELGSLCSIEEAEPEQNMKREFEVKTAEDNAFWFMLPTNEGRDVELMEQLRSLNERLQTEEQKQDCLSEPNAEPAETVEQGG